MTPVAPAPTTDRLLLDAIDKKILGLSLAPVFGRAPRPPAVFLLCTHEWGNLGDLAINYDEVALLEEAFPDRPVFSVSRAAVAANWDRVLRAIGSDDVIAIHGGGNVGDIWPHEEAARLAVVRAFPRNTIISLPQSIHFSSADALAHSMDVYRDHERLLLCVRDDHSLQIARAHLPATRVLRADDVVTGHRYPFPFLPARPHVLFVQRDDAERRPDSGIDGLRERLAADGETVERTDTVVPDLAFSNLELSAKLVYQKIDQLHAAEVVVTDRLHGAVFALLAGRPVIVYENSYGKIGGALSSLLPALGERIVFADALPPEALDTELRRLRALPDTPLRPADVLRGRRGEFLSALRTWTASSAPAPGGAAE